MPSSPNRKAREQGIELRDINLWLRYETHPTQHYCAFCRAGLFRSQFRMVSMVYGEGVEEPFLSPPISMQCRCGTRYHLQGMNQ